ncbi:MAG: c-type cytochrome, partial [Pirellulaceae bacterium]|nr:c-type cytochrome [Pirellulaceae bacterium]
MLSRDATETQRAHGLWILQRLGELTPADWQPRIGDDSPLVRLHVVKVLAEAEDWDEAIIAAVLARLEDEDGFVVRAAVEALARHPREEAVEPLLLLLANADAADACLIHAARMSLRDALREFGRFDHWERRFSESAVYLKRLADVSVGIPSPSAAAFLWHRFLKDEYPQERQSDLLRHIIRNIDAGTLPAVLALAETYVDRDEAAQIAVASAIYRGSQERGLKISPTIRQWGERLVRPLLTSDDAARVHQGVELTRQMRLQGLAKELSRLCARKAPVPAERLAAIQAMLAVNPVESVALFFTFVYDQQELPALRQFAAEKLANRKDTELRERILTKLPTDSHLIALGFARGLIIDADGANALLDLVEQGKVSPRVLQDAKIGRLLPVSGLANGASRRKELVANLPSLDAQTQQLIRQRWVAFRKAAPDAARGAEVYRETCAACHQLDNQGQKVGPELDGVGQRGVERLLEDILDPNRAVDKNYCVTVIVTEAGQVFTGLVTGQEGQVLLLVDQTGKQQRIPLAEIDERRVIEGSAMPSNLGETIKAADLNDLMGFLLKKTVKKQ